VLLSTEQLLKARRGTREHALRIAYQDRPDLILFTCASLICAGGRRCPASACAAALALPKPLVAYATSMSRGTCSPAIPAMFWVKQAFAVQELVLARAAVTARAQLRLAARAEDPGVRCAPQAADRGAVAAALWGYPAFVRGGRSRLVCPKPPSASNLRRATVDEDLATSHEAAVLCSQKQRQRRGLGCISDAAERSLLESCARIASAAPLSSATPFNPGVSSQRECPPM
jgi:hypothetical protein